MRATTQAPVTIQVRAITEIATTRTMLTGATAGILSPGCSAAIRRLIRLGPRVPAAASAMAGLGTAAVGPLGIVAGADTVVGEAAEDMGEGVAVMATDRRRRGKQCVNE